MAIELEIIARPRHHGCDRFADERIAKHPDSASGAQIGLFQPTSPPDPLGNGAGRPTNLGGPKIESTRARRCPVAHSFGADRWLETGAARVTSAARNASMTVEIEYRKRSRSWCEFSDHRRRSTTAGRANPTILRNDTPAPLDERSLASVPLPASVRRQILVHQIVEMAPIACALAAGAAASTNFSGCCVRSSRAKRPPTDHHMRVARDPLQRNANAATAAGRRPHTLRRAVVESCP